MRPSVCPGCDTPVESGGCLPVALHIPSRLARRLTVQVGRHLEMCRALSLWPFTIKHVPIRPQITAAAVVQTTRGGRQADMSSGDTLRQG